MTTQPTPQPAPTIVLVEDDLDTRQLYELTFELEGFRVASSSSRELG